jgi:hypothetical protein
MEVLRQGVSFLDLGDDAQNRKLVEHLTVIRRVLFNNQLDPLFSIVFGCQRAMGELMIQPMDSTNIRDRQCIGYAEFCSKIETDKWFAGWFQGLDTDISELAKREDVRIDRLAALESSLADLIDFLDPKNVRFPLRQPLRVSGISSQQRAAWGSQWWGNNTN